jgi:hypothetical protein
MSERIAIDTSAAVDFLRPDRPNPPFKDTDTIVLPLPVVGELSPALLPPTVVTKTWRRSISSPDYGTY